MPRGLIKTGIAAALHYTGADRWLGRRPDPATLPLILGYHRVVEDFAASAERAIPAMLVDVRTLERHIDWLARRFDLVGLDEAAARAVSGRRHRRPAAVLTFDDGYRDVYENAFPLLQRKGIPSAVFVVTGLTGTRDLLLHDELYLLVTRCFGLWTDPRRELAQALRECGVDPDVSARIGATAVSPYAAVRTLLTQLAQPQARELVRRLHERARLRRSELDGMEMMDWQMARAMHEAGHVIGSHTRTHAYLTNEDPAAVADELRGSREEIRRHLGFDAEHLAYPNGDFNQAVADAAADAGYRYAYTTCACTGAAAPELTIPRRMVWERSGIGSGGRFSSAVFHCETRGVFEHFAGCGRARHA